jgi:hypothetical protein
MKNKFKQEDVDTIISFLNMIAKNAKWDGIQIKEMSEYITLYKKVQALIPKMEANILEIKQVVEPQKKEE